MSINSGSGITNSSLRVTPISRGAILRYDYRNTEHYMNDGYHAGTNQKVSVF